MRVFVGCPTAALKEYCLQEYVDGLKALTWKDKDFLMVDNSGTPEYAEKIKKLGIPVVHDEPLPDVKERIAHSRNILREKVLKDGYDYFLSLEQDVIPPPDIIERLLSHNKKVITGVYFTVYVMDGMQKMRPLVWKQDTENPDKIVFMNDEVKAARGKTSALSQIAAAGVGCVLIHRSVLEKIKFRVANNTYDDIPFWKDCAANGFERCADLAIVCRHVVDINGQILMLPGNV
jgi:GT2 family glycosyltransferase